MEKSQIQEVTHHEIDYGLLFCLITCLGSLIDRTDAL